MPEEKPPKDLTLVLGTRLGVLRSNLQRVENVLNATRHRGAQLEDLDRVLGERGVAQKIHDLKKKLDFVAHCFRENEADVGKKKLDETMKIVESLREEFARCETARQELGHRRVSFDEGVDRSLSVKLVAEATKRAGKIKSLEEQLDKVKNGKAGDLGKVWEEYSGVFDEKSQLLFGQYVDVIRGVALRESGLDAGICQYAQMLLHRLERAVFFEWSSLAIPAHRAPTGPTSHFVRLGFPEWTIWALPLMVHDFGKILLSEHSDFAKVVDELAKPLTADSTREHLVDCLADAFAAYSVGPAYGCAAILMRLNPVPPERGSHVPDSDRATMIFEIWRRADDKAKELTFGTPLRKSLEEEWATALRQATGGVPAAKKGEADVSKWAQAMWEWLEKNSSYSAYQARSWVQNAHDWSTKFLPEEGKEAEEIEPRDADVRDVLNAAWACRIENPERVAEIDRAARQLLNKMSERARPKGGDEKLIQAVPSRQESRIE